MQYKNFERTKEGFVFDKSIVDAIWQYGGGKKGHIRNCICVRFKEGSEHEFCTINRSEDIFLQADECIEQYKQKHA